MNSILFVDPDLAGQIPTEDLNPTFQTLRQAIASVKNLLQALAQDRINFYSIFEKTFGSSYNTDIAESIRTQWADGDFSKVPGIHIWNGSEKVILGAYSSTTNHIYLAQWLIEQKDAPTLANVLLEEIGHFIDTQINTSDTPGDEGQLFSELVRGNELGDEQLAAINRENDWQTITVDGQKLTVETAVFSAGNLVIYRVGAGSNALSNAGTAVFWMSTLQRVV